MTDHAPLCCPKCGEEAEPGFVACWKCRTPLPVPVALVVADPPEDTAAAATAEAAPPRSKPPRPARSPKRIQVAIGFILVAIHLVILIDSTARNDPEAGAFAGGGMIAYGVPGSLLIYFGLRARYMQRVTDESERMLGVVAESLHWMLPGYVALVLSFILGVGWVGGLTAAIIGAVVAVLLANHEGSVAGQAWHGQPSVQRAFDCRMGQIDRDRVSADLGVMVRTTNISGLRRKFIQSVDWQRREEVVVAFGVLCRDLRDRHVDRSGELIPVLNEILVRCATEPYGGSHRENCIEHVEMLLRSLKRPAV